MLLPRSLHSLIVAVPCSVPFGGNTMLFAIVRRGKKAGIRLVPHRYKDDNRYHVCLGKRGPYIPISDERDIPEYLANGYSLNMSSGDEGHSPTLISPGSIAGWK